MANRENYGYRDLLFSAWHRLIPAVRAIDIDLSQFPKDSEQPSTICETKIKFNADIVPYGLEWRGAYSLTKSIAEKSGAKGVFLVYHPRTPNQGFDEMHSRLLKHYYDIDRQLKKLSLTRQEILNTIILYCYKGFGERKAYDSFISQMAAKLIVPDISEPIIRDTTIPFRDMFQRHALEISDYQDSRNIILPSKATGSLILPGEEMIEKQLPLFDCLEGLPND